MTLRVLAFLAMLLVATPVSAITMYSYTGGNFVEVSGVYTTNDHLSGYFTVADDVVFMGGARLVTLTWLDYSFTDGHQTLTPANSEGGGSFSDNAGLWSFGIVGIGDAVGNQIFSVSVFGRSDWALSALGSGGNNDSIGGSRPGTWTITSVPEPMTLLLVLAGIGGVIGARRFYRS